MATSISFQNQQTSINKPLGFNQIPGDFFSIELAASALEGLYLWRKNGNRWDFEKGDEFLSNVLECIPKLTDSVKIQLRNYIANESWNLGQASL